MLFEPPFVSPAYCIIWAIIVTHNRQLHRKAKHFAGSFPDH